MGRWEDVMVPGVTSNSLKNVNVVSADEVKLVYSNIYTNKKEKNKDWAEK